MILIIGGSGFLGYFLHEKLIELGKKVHSTFNQNFINRDDFEHLDLMDESSVKEIINNKKPEIVIYAAGLTNVDLCEEDNVLARELNVEGIRNVIDATREYDSKIIYISTSAIFSGKKEEYYEDDKPDPISFYGKTKLEGEVIVMNSGLKNMIIRTDQPYGWKKEWHHTNSVLRVIENLKQGKDFREILDWYNTPTYVKDIILAIIELINKEQKGIFHVVGTDYNNRLNFSKKVSDVFGLKQNKIKEINSKDLKLPAKRGNVKLVSKKIAGFDIIMSSFSKGLEKMKREVNYNEKY